MRKELGRTHGWKLRRKIQHKLSIPSGQSCWKWNGLGQLLSWETSQQKWGDNWPDWYRRDWLKHNMAGQPLGNRSEREFLKKVFNKMTTCRDVCQAERTNKNLMGLVEARRHFHLFPWRCRRRLTESWSLGKEALREKGNFWKVAATARTGTMQHPQKQSMYLRFSHQVVRLFAVPLIH